MRWPVKRRAVRVVNVFLSFFMLMFPLPRASAGTEMGLITGDGVNTRSGPGVEFDKVGRFQSGDRVTILDEADKWLKVRDEEGREVWVFARWVERLPVEPEPEPPKPVRILPSPADSLPVIMAEEQEIPIEAPPLIDQKERRFPWLWIGAGAAAAGGVAILALSGDNGADETSGSLTFDIQFP